MSNKIFEIKTKFHASTLPPALVGLFVDGVFARSLSNDSRFTSAVILRDKKSDWRVRDYQGRNQEKLGQKQILVTTGAIFDIVFQQLRQEYIGGTGYAQIYSLADCMWYMLDKKLNGISHQPHKGDTTLKDKKSNYRRFEHPDAILSSRYRSLYPSNKDIAEEVAIHKSDDYWSYECEPLSSQIEDKFRDKHFTSPTDKDLKKQRSYTRQGFECRLPQNELSCSSYEFLCLREAYYA